MYTAHCTVSLRGTPYTCMSNYTLCSFRWFVSFNNLRLTHRLTLHTVCNIQRSATGATENARVENAGASKMKGWKSQELKLRHQIAGVEIAGETSMESQNSRSQTLLCRVEHWISLPKWVTTANRTNVIQNDVTHLCILRAECFLLLNTRVSLQIHTVR